MGSKSQQFIGEKMDLVRMENIYKSFGSVVALKGVDFNVGTNEIVGLIGDNGAGKSTLIKILVGVHQPDKGKIFIRGEEIKKMTVQKARELKIEAVFQEQALGLKQSIWRNIFLGREKTFRYLGLLKVNEMERESQKLMTQLGFRVQALLPDAIAGHLSGGERQGIAIARALYFDADLIILDEPTTALSITEAQKILGYVSEIKKKGKSCIFISHNIHHVYPIADRLVILDRGKVVADIKKEEITLDELIEKMLMIKSD
jgi:simple sugar transport system ATP-binding protein